MKYQNKNNEVNQLEIKNKLNNNISLPKKNRLKEKHIA